MNTRFGRKLQLRLDRFELLRAGVECTRGWASGKSPTCDLRPAPGRTTGPQPVLHSECCPRSAHSVGSDSTRRLFWPVESLRAAWSAENPTRPSDSCQCCPGRNSGQRWPAHCRPYAATPHGTRDQIDPPCRPSRPAVAMLFTCNWSPGAFAAATRAPFR